MYHTALPYGQKTDAEPAQAWIGGRSRAFVHDIRWGLPDAYDAVDVIYAELPWADGYDEFNARAGVDDAPPFNKLLYILNRELGRLGKPWIILVGHAASRHLGCEWMRPASLHGSLVALMGALGPMPPDDIRDTADVIQWLSSNPDYQTVGDFCCGYGQTAQIFAKARKRFIVSDFNAACIGHVAREAKTWMA